MPAAKGNLRTQGEVGEAGVVNGWVDFATAKVGAVIESESQPAVEI